MKRDCVVAARRKMPTALLGMAMLLLTRPLWGVDPQPATTTSVGSTSTAHDVSDLRQELNAALAHIDELQKRLDQKQTAADFQERLDGELTRIRGMEKRLNELAFVSSSPVQQGTAVSDSSLQTSSVAAPIAASTPTGPVTLGSLLGPTSLSGFVDTYYNYNSGQPASRTNGYRTFDALSNQFALNLVELVVDKQPDAAASRTGYHIALGYGQAINAINASDPGGLGFDQYLKEAYFSYLAPVGKGLQVDFGKFVTPAGAEVIETKDNWNYSRGLLFSYAIPFYHFGMRAKYNFNDKYNLTGFVDNGWNDIVANNTGKTYGLSLGWNPTKKIGFSENYMAGPEQANNTSNWRQLWDTVVTFNPNAKLSLMANVDYGRGDRMPGVVDPVFWTGFAGYVKYQFNNKYALATRYEYYDDHNGFTTGTAQDLNGFTGTFQRMIGNNIISRLEYRRDMSNQPTFVKGVLPVTSQNTFTAGLVFTFDTHEAR